MPKESCLVPQDLTEPLIQKFQDSPPDCWDSDDGFWTPVDWKDPASWAAWTGCGQEEAGVLRK